MHSVFQKHVRARRGNRLDEARASEIFSGDAWLGEEAVKLGLVDGINDVSTVIAEEFGDDVELKQISTAPSIPWPLSMLSGGSEHSTVGVEQDGRVSILTDPAALGSLTDAACTTLEHRAMWGKYLTY